MHLLVYSLLPVCVRDASNASIGTPSLLGIYWHVTGTYWHSITASLAQLLRLLLGSELATNLARCTVRLIILHPCGHQPVEVDSNHRIYTSVRSGCIVYIQNRHIEAVADIFQAGETGSLCQFYLQVDLRGYRLTDLLEAHRQRKY